MHSLSNVSGRRAICTIVSVTNLWAQTKSMIRVKLRLAAFRGENRFISGFFTAADQIRRREKA